MNSSAPSGKAVFVAMGAAQLNEAAGGLAKAFAAVFAEICEGDVEATVASMSQRYAREVIMAFNDSNNAGYFLPIRSEPEADVCGFLAIPPCRTFMALCTWYNTERSA